MVKNIIISMFIVSLTLHAVVMEEGEFIKQKQELNRLKKELDQFYKVKENQYQKNKKELDSIDADIKKQLQNIKDEKAANKKVLAEIKQTIVSKAMKLYGKMKVKLVKSILQKKIDNGEINEVFDIMIRLKDKRVMKLLKMFDTDTSTELMDMMSKYKKNNKSKGEK